MIPPGLADTRRCGLLSLFTAMPAPTMNIEINLTIRLAIGFDSPGPQAFGKDGLPVVVVAVPVHPAHVVAGIEGIVILRPVVLAGGQFGFGPVREGSAGNDG